MINNDLEEFNHVQEKHKSRYLKGAKEPQKGTKDQNDSNSSGISAGAEGRDARLNKE